MSLRELLARDHVQASLLLSKVYFHLTNYDQSIRYALRAGSLFNLDEPSCYVQTILAKAIDQYIEVRVNQPTVAVDPALEAIYERMVERCLVAGEYKQAIGIALEAHRIDVLEVSLKTADASCKQECLEFTQRAALRLGHKPAWQREILLAIVGIAEGLPDPDFVFICECLVLIDEADRCGQILRVLVKEGKLEIAYQIGFNLYQTATQAFLAAVMACGEKDTEDSHMAVLSEILAGTATIRLRLEFLYRSNHSDIQILDRIKESLNVHNSMHHSALTFCNAIMHAGTTNDQFLRKNLEWLSHANNWSKFNAASALGVIHRGQLLHSRTILEPYLPKEGASSEYSEGGALYALGLIHAKHGDDQLDYLMAHLQKDSATEVIQHGCCLGIGAAAMASRNQAVLEALKGVLYGDSAVAGEAASLAIGLVMLGSGDADLIAELLQYAHETQHEKIIRGIALAIALILYGRQQDADVVIEQLSQEKDGILRFGAAWAIAMAYAGSSSNSAIRRLLHAAVSDTDDSVRRSSVTALGFILYKNPDELPRLVELLAGSYNPHVRYGAAMALGLAFAGSGSDTAKALIRPMCQDLTDFVRQGAFLSLAMIDMQVNSKSNSQKEAESTTKTTSETDDIRKILERSCTLKMEDPIARFGAILAQGFLDAGGRNVVLSLGTGSGNDMAAIAGGLLFCQFWYWYPLVHFASLALQPTALIAVTRSLELPKGLTAHCAAPPSQFAYPPPLKPATVTAAKKMFTAVLSTTARAEKKKRGASKKLSTTTEAMEIDETAATAEEQPIAETPAAEPSFHELANLSRVTREQASLVSFKTDQRFQPVAKPNYLGGITVVLDCKPQEGPAEMIPQSDLSPSEIKAIPEQKTTTTSATAENGNITPPAPFEAAEI